MQNRVRRGVYDENSFPAFVQMHEALFQSSSSIELIDRTLREHFPYCTDFNEDKSEMTFCYNTAMKRASCVTCSMASLTRAP
jgi:hypothetical protein